MWHAHRSRTADTELGDLLTRLEQSPLVAGAMLLGSGVASLAPDSDIDLLVVLNILPPARTGLTWVQSRLTDLVFASRSELIALADQVDPMVLSDDWAGRLTEMVRTGRTVLDRERWLETLHEDFVAREVVVPEDRNDSRRRWNKANYNLAQARRYAQATDSAYREALELRMTYSLADLMVDYFAVRGLRWEGEKNALRYWADGDEGYKALFLTCLREPELSPRVAQYGELVRMTFAPVGEPWPVESICFPGGEVDAGHADELWAAISTAD